MQSFGIIAELPLQSWSKAHNSKAENAPRFNQFIDVVRRKTPKFVMLKNIMGASKLTSHLTALDVLGDYGYQVSDFIPGNNGTLAIALKTNE